MPLDVGLIHNLSKFVTERASKVVEGSWVQKLLDNPPTSAFLRIARS